MGHSPFITILHQINPEPNHSDALLDLRGILALRTRLRLGLKAAASIACVTVSEGLLAI